jgi:hypothetical protein
VVEFKFFEVVVVEFELFEVVVVELKSGCGRIQAF